MYMGFTQNLCLSPLGRNQLDPTDLFWVRGVVVVEGCGSPPPRLVWGQRRVGQCDSRRADCHSYCAPTHHTQLDASLQWEREEESKVHVHTELGDKVKVTLWRHHTKNGDALLIHVNPFACGSNPKSQVSTVQDSPTTLLCMYLSKSRTTQPSHTMAHATYVEVNTCVCAMAPRYIYYTWIITPSIGKALERQVHLDGSIIYLKGWCHRTLPHASEL